MLWVRLDVSYRRFIVAEMRTTSEQRKLFRLILRFWVGWLLNFPSGISQQQPQGLDLQLMAIGLVLRSLLHAQHIWRNLGTYTLLFLTLPVLKGDVMDSNEFLLVRDDSSSNNSDGTNTDGDSEQPPAQIHVGEVVTVVQIRVVGEAHAPCQTKDIWLRQIEYTYFIAHNFYIGYCFIIFLKLWLQCRSYR